KDTNFKANHNTYTQNSNVASDGFANAKILILKQITTRVFSISKVKKMVLLMQRY
ncbi:hypothetical protein HMPREF0653_02414, partial [Prevotella disiens JCM 6334 = ATCC 29426]